MLPSPISQNWSIRVKFLVFLFKICHPKFTSTGLKVNILLEKYPKTSTQFVLLIFYMRRYFSSFLVFIPSLSTFFSLAQLNVVWAARKEKWARDTLVKGKHLIEFTFELSPSLCIFWATIQLDQLQGTSLSAHRFKSWSLFAKKSRETSD